MDLARLLDDRADTIQEQAREALHSSRLAHYEVDPALADERLRKLLALVRESVRAGHVGPVVAHASRVARERHEAGFALYEVQTAFNVLEEALWVRILEELPRDEQVPALGTVSTILGAAKDVLAREYVALAAHERPRVVDTRALMRGT